MPTTSPRLPAELKKRVTAAAEKRGATPNAFMVQAIDDSARAAELRAPYVASAERARNTILRTGNGYDADQVHAFIRSRL